MQYIDGEYLHSSLEAVGKEFRQAIINAALKMFLPRKDATMHLSRIELIVPPSHVLSKALFRRGFDAHASRIHLTLDVVAL